MPNIQLKRLSDVTLALPEINTLFLNTQAPSKPQPLALRFPGSPTLGICESGSLVPDLFLAAEPFTASSLSGFIFNLRTEIADDAPITAARQTG